MTHSENVSYKLQDVSLVQALKDVGYISWLFATVVGAPSVLSLFQYVFVDYQFWRVFQWLIDGYENLLAVLAVFIDPIAEGAIGFLRSLFEVPFRLQPHWQPLFVLMVIFVSANGRTIWGDGYKTVAVVVIAVMSFVGLLGACLAGLVDASAPWWAQGIAAAAPVLSIFVGMALSYSISSVVFSFGQPYRRPISAYLYRGVVLGSLAYAIAALISYSKLVSAHAGIFTIFVGLFVYGTYWLVDGYQSKNASEVRFGLRLVGGFVFALLVLATNTFMMLFGLFAI